MALTVTIAVNGGTVATFDDVPYEEGRNVQQAMEAAYDANPPAASVLGFAARYFGASLGYELSMLDGISLQVGLDGATWLFWELKINGTYSGFGMDQTFPNDGDVISWNYTLYTADQHAGTRYEQIHAQLSGS